jgi:hypothetical protein
VILAVASLARHRLAGRAGSTLLLVVAVAAATGLTATIRAVGLSATDAAVGAALTALDPADRALRITGYGPSATGSVALDRAARTALDGTAAFAEPLASGVILRRVRDPGAPYDLQVVAVDGATRWISLLAGRMPARCDGSECEAVLLSGVEEPGDLPGVLHVGALVVHLVGRATMASPIPLGHLDERGPQKPPADPTTQGVDPAPALLLLDGVAGVAGAPGAAAIGRTYLWTAPLRASVLHPWTVPSFEDALGAARARLASSAPALSLASPSEPIRREIARGLANDGRLLLVGTLGGAVLVAFVGYAALLGRRDLRGELDRLAAAGAGRTAGALLVTIEVLVPTLLGTAAGWAGAAVVARFTVTGAGSDPGGVIGHSLFDAGGLGLAGFVLGAAIVAVLAGLLGVARRGAVAGLLPGGLAIAAFVGWRVVAGGGLSVDALGSSVEAPILVAIPAITGIAVAAAALALVPLILRRLAKTRRHRSLSVRLALISLARDPVRPAATIVILAFGIGGLAFGLIDAATLRRGIADRAAFAIGMDLRVTEAASGLTLSATVAPFDRYGTLGAGAQAVPVAHVQAGAGPAGGVTVLGLPPSAIPLLQGWRDDLGADQGAIGAAIEVPGQFAVPGVALDPGASTVGVTVTHSGDPVYLSVVIVARDGDSARLFLGTLHPGRERLEAPLPEGARGGRIIAIIVSEGRLIAGPTHPAGLARATLTFEGLDELAGRDPVSVEVSGAQSAVLRAPLPTDALVLPAIVGPDIAAAARATGDGILTLTLGDRRLARIRVAAVMPRFPGLPAAGRSFAVVALDPLLMAMDGAAPGAGRPDEAWIRVADPGRLAATRAALQGPPFRQTVVRSRADLELAGVADPFSRSVLAAIAAAGTVGLLLAAIGLALGVLTDVRDETGDLHDLEAQGVGPRSLGRQVRVRALLLAAAGTAAGVTMGILLSAVETAAVGTGADATSPGLPLVLDVPWGSLAAAAAIPVLVAAALGWIGTRRAFRASARSGHRR